ncbi:MAG: hypothetical protein Q8R55_03175 [Candidatus Taylorbacteria bacterium]|nr:hypothetical protein [Candidatus Taylorbacteria bacterium]
MEPLVRRLETLVNADVSKEEILRQLRQAKPDLKKGEVLCNAERLVGTFTTPAERRRAHEYLKDVMPLEESYITSAGNLGTTHDEVTVWDNPKKPLPFVGLITLVCFLVVSLATYWLGFETASYAVILGGVGIAFIVSLERAVANNKYSARQELYRNILRRAEFFESTLEKVSFT